MSCISWVFINSRASTPAGGDDDNIKREAIWHCKSADLGIEFSSYYALESGECVCVSRQEILGLLGELLATTSLVDDQSGDRNALMDLKRLVAACSDENEYSISVDW